MPVTAQTPYNIFTAAPGATVFPSGFRVIKAADLVVKVNGATVTSGFTVSGLGAAGGVDVTFGTPMSGGEKVELLREIPLVRPTDYQQLGDFLSPVVNQDFDRPWHALQGIALRLGGALRLPYPEQAIELPPAAARARKAVVFDELGRPKVSEDDYDAAVARIDAFIQDMSPYLNTLNDELLMNINFPLDLGLIADPFIYNTFDLGAL